MKISVLLPTRNRLTYLRYAIQSVLRQNAADWEIVVSDNDSEDDIARYVRSLGDARIRYFRTQEFLPVTENWNSALSHSDGDYIIMLGDDDCLLPGYFATIRRLAAEHGEPDVLYSSGYVYGYPRAFPGHPDGFLHRSGCAEFLRRSPEPFLLDRATARRVVEHSLRFQLRFDYNMQYSTISRRAVDEILQRGPFFQSPFPDFYATNVLFLKAERILVCPQPLVAIGITPKSYGYFHFNQQERAGVEFLQGVSEGAAPGRLAGVVLPGTNMNTSWLLAMEMIMSNYGAESGLRLAYGRYRALQLLNHYENRLNGVASPDEVAETRRRAHRWERALYGGATGLARLFGRRRARSLIRAVRARLAQYPADWHAQYIAQSCTNILELYDFLAAGGDAR